jgi:hypothetical protein
MPTLKHSKSDLRTDALTRRVKRRKVRAFYRAFAARHPSVRSPFTPARRVAAGIGGGATVIGLLAMATGFSQEISEGASDMMSQLIGMSVIAGLMLVGGVILIWFYIRVTVRRGTPRRHYRLADFATENGMSYHPGPLSGRHLTPLSERGRLTLTRVMRTRSPRPIEYANYELQTGTAGETGGRNTQFGGLCAIRLSTNLPHIVLQARSRTNLSAQAVPGRAQRLSLEGNFDDHFTLYCPKEYERDALYLFTPDVMARLIDRVHEFDVEIIDDWLFFVTSRDVVTLQPQTWDGLVDASTALTDKITRWERWRDDRLPVTDAPLAGSSVAAHGPGRVGVRGRRLRMTVGPGVLLWIGITVVLVTGVVMSNLL